MKSKFVQGALWAAFVFGTPLISDGSFLVAQEPAQGLPGAQHEALHALAGSWEVYVDSQLAGSATATLRLDGRFLEVEIDADAGPMQKIIYTFGFDRRNGVYTVIAMDDSGTYWVTGTGIRDGGRIPMYGKDKDPVMEAMGFEKEFAIVLTIESPRRFGIEILFIDTRTPERREISFLTFDLRRVA